MSKFAMSGHRPSFLAAILVPVLALLLACGPGEEPTPVPTPTKPAAVATPTPTPSAVVASPTPTPSAVVASPTPTTVAAPSPTSTPGVQPQRGGTMKWATNEYAPNFDPYSTPIVIPNRWTAKLHNNLLVNYKDDVVECEVCSEWHLENNGKTMVFTLIPGIKFHDGREMTSADVKYSREILHREDAGNVRWGDLRSLWSYEGVH